MRKLRQRSATSFQLDNRGGVSGNIGKRRTLAGISPKLMKILGNRITGPESGPGSLGIKRTLFLLFRAGMKSIDAGGNFTIQKIRLGERNIDLTSARRRRHIKAQALTLSKQIFFTETEFEKGTAGGRKTKSEGNRTGGFLFHFHLDQRLVGSAARHLLDNNFFEEIQILDTLF